MRWLAGLALTIFVLQPAPASAVDWLSFFGSNPVSKNAITPTPIQPNAMGTSPQPEPSTPSGGPGPISCATAFSPFFNKTVYTDPRATDAICGSGNSSRNVSDSNSNANSNIDLSGLCKNGVISVRTITGQVEQRPCASAGTQKQTVTQPARKESPVSAPPPQPQANTNTQPDESSDDSSWMVGDTVEDAIRGKLPTQPTQQRPATAYTQAPRMPNYNQNANCAQLQMQFRRAVANTGSSIDPNLYRTAALLDQYCGGAR